MTGGVRKEVYRGNYGAEVAKRAALASNLSAEASGSLAGVKPKVAKSVRTKYWFEDKEKIWVTGRH
eukprot:9469261-Pyramimonas_sp.AAC.1